MTRIVKSGTGWRIGWHREAPSYQGMVGGDDWAFELTGAELDDFCRLLLQLAQTMQQMRSELMDEERIACEAESERLWLEVEGYPHYYSLRLILHGQRRCEGNWTPEVVGELVQAAASLKVF